MSSFRRNVSVSKWKFTQRDKDENVKLRTHNLMDGGELSVPDHEHDTFLRMCSECICDGEKLYVVEQRSHPAYNLFFDFDVCLFKTIESHDFYVNIGKLLVSTLCELFDDTVSSFEIVCSIADVKQIKKHQADCYKYGVHITCSSLVVNKEIMLRVREAVVQKFQNNMEKDGPTTWADDIDKVVYESSGFRMLFSRKGCKCKCSQKHRDLCDKCEGTGKVDEGRPYIPLFSMKNDFSYTTYSNTISFDFVYEMLQKTSIRVTRPHGVIEFNRSPPSWFEDTSLFDAPDGLIVSAPSAKRTRVNLTEGLESVESKLQDKKEVSFDDLKSINIWFQSLCNKRYLPKQYKGIEITRAFSFSNNNVRSNIVIRIDSQYCLNIGREHSTNTVYMLLNTLTKKAVMKCYCRCETTEGRRSIVKGKIQMCKDFSSHVIDASDLQLKVGCDITSRVIKPRVLSMF